MGVPLHAQQQPHIHIIRAGSNAAVHAFTNIAVQIRMLQASTDVVLLSAILLSTL
jgi:hypothetical protein